MLYLETQTHEDLVAKCLLESPATAKKLSIKLSEEGVDLSTSGLYKILHKLEEAGVILKKKTVFSISNEWKRAVLELLGTHEELSLKEGEKITFDLRSASQTDKQWKQYAYLLEKEASVHGLYIYNPHQFWYYLPDRAKSEKEFVQYLNDNRIRTYHTSWGTTEFDKQFAREVRTSTYQVNFENIGMLSHRDNITVFGDYIINTQISEGLFQQIDTAYNSASNIRELKREIAKAVSKPHKYRFRLERNKKKAQELTKKLSRHFFVPTSTPH